MARLPQVGGDSGSWGDVLNDYLSTSHNTDGTLKADTVGAPQLKPNAVTGAAIANGSISNAKIADGAVNAAQIADNAVTMAKLADAGQADGIATLDADARLPEAQVPERLSESALKATTLEIGATAFQAPATGTVAIIGDSTSQNGASDLGIGGYTTQRMQDSWLVFAAIAANQRFRIVRHGGIWGNTTSQMVARFMADIAPSNPDVVIILGGRNDPINSISVETTMSNIAQLVTMAQSIGARPVVCTPLPTSTTAQLRQQMASIANRIRGYVRAQSIPCLDLYALTVDPMTGNMAALYNDHDDSDADPADGIHPGNSGIKAIGEWASPILAAMFPEAPAAVALDVADADNLIGGPQGLFQGISDPSNSGFTTGGWGIGSKPTAGFETYATADVAGWRGKALDLTTTAWAGGTVPALQIRRNLTMGATLAVGDVIEYTGRVKVLQNSLPKGKRVQCAILFEGVNQTVTAADTNKTLDGTFYLRTKVPVGATGVRVQFLIPNDPVGTARMQVGQVVVRNLTKLGLA